MFDHEDREQNELDEQYVSDLRAALIKAIKEADYYYNKYQWGDEGIKTDKAPNLDNERVLSKYLTVL